jgi:hypothetical protein
MPIPGSRTDQVDSPLDTFARRLAGGISRRDALRAGGVVLAGAVTATPTGAWAALTRRCPPHRFDCNGRCCPKGEVCLPPEHRGGKRRCGCPDKKTRCADECVNLHSDPHNCGRCGHACGAGSSCVAGRCTTTTECQPGQTVCAGVCVDLQSDPQNCGTCGTTCSSYFATSSCVSGTCKIDSCDPNWINCNGNPLDGCNCFGTTCNGTMCGS